MASTLKTFLMAALMTGVCGHAMAATFYVGGLGDDKKNDGLSELKPFRTLQKAADLVKAGDTVVALNGTYTSNPTVWTNAVVQINASGTPDKYITFKAKDGATPVISMAGNQRVWYGVAIRGSYIDFSGFEVIGTAKDITLARATAVGKAAMQTYVDTLAANKLNPKIAVKVPGDFPTNSACVSAEDVHHVNIRKNVVHDCAASGIVAAKTDYMRVQSNVVYNTSKWTVYDTSGINFHRSRSFDTSIAGYHNFILNNITFNSANTQPYYADALAPIQKSGIIAYDSVVPTDGNGIIIDVNQKSVDGKPYLGRTLIQGNIAYGNGGQGIHVFLSNHVDIFNNTAYMNNVCTVAGSTCGNRNSGQISVSQADDVKVYNNVMSAPADKPTFWTWKATNLDKNNNLLFNQGGKLLMSKGVLVSSKDIVSDPMFLRGDTLMSTINSPVDIRDSMAALRMSVKSAGRNAGQDVVMVGSFSVRPVGMDGQQTPHNTMGAIWVGHNR